MDNEDTVLLALDFFTVINGKGITNAKTVHGCDGYCQ